MKKVVPVPIAVWLEVAKEVVQQYEPQPEGSITAKQLAEASNPPRSIRSARDILTRMVQAERAVKVPWHGPPGSRFVYILKENGQKS